MSRPTIDKVESDGRSVQGEFTELEEELQERVIRQDLMIRQSEQQQRR